MAQVTTGSFTLYLPRQEPIAVRGKASIPSGPRWISESMPDPLVIEGALTTDAEGRRTLIVAAIVLDALATARRILG